MLYNDFPPILYHSCIRNYTILVYPIRLHCKAIFAYVMCARTILKKKLRRFIFEAHQTSVSHSSIHKTCLQSSLGTSPSDENFYIYTHDSSNMFWRLVLQFIATLDIAMHDPMRMIISLTLINPQCDNYYHILKTLLKIIKHCLEFLFQFFYTYIYIYIHIYIHIYIYIHGA